MLIDLILLKRNLCVISAFNSIIIYLSLLSLRTSRQTIGENRRWIVKLLFLMALFISSELMAQDLQDNTTTRPKGMGSAFVSIANDKNTIWYNPAGVTRLRKARSRRSFIF